MGESARTHTHTLSLSSLPPCRWAGPTAEKGSLKLYEIDMATARRLLGRRAIIGASASTPNEVLLACKAGADYLGLGSVFATSTKETTRRILGIAGLRQLLEVMEFCV